jgi:hypothetical protein
MSSSGSEKKGIGFGGDHHAASRVDIGDPHHPGMGVPGAGGVGLVGVGSMLSSNDGDAGE